MSGLESLYQELILDHSKSPHGRGLAAEEGRNASSHQHNPVCGDDITLRVRLDVDDAEVIRISNSTPFGLSSGVCTNSLPRITRFIEGLEVGTVNIWEVPGYRIEMSPFGGIKDSGNGIKEGVMEAMKFFTNVKTWSLPWPA